MCRKRSSGFVRAPFSALWRPTAVRRARPHSAASRPEPPRGSLVAEPGQHQRAVSICVVLHFFLLSSIFPLTMKDKEWMLQNFQCISKLIFYFSINYILLQITMTDRNHLHWVDQLFQVTNIHAPSTARALILRKDATNCFVRVKIVCCKM